MLICRALLTPSDAAQAQARKRFFADKEAMLLPSFWRDIVRRCYAACVMRTTIMFYYRDDKSCHTIFTCAQHARAEERRAE